MPEIPDGYTEQGYIAEVPRLHQALRFTFRPAIAEEVAGLYDKVVKQTGPQFERTSAEWLAPRILSWDLKGDSGEDLAVTADAIRHMRPRLYRRLRDIILGTEPSDESPPLDLDADAKNLPSGSASS